MTEPKPVVLPLHHDPIAMQKYELFLKLARVSPKKNAEKVHFRLFWSIFKREKERFRRVFGLFSSCFRSVFELFCGLSRIGLKVDSG